MLGVERPERSAPALWGAAAISPRPRRMVRTATTSRLRGSLHPAARDATSPQARAVEDFACELGGDLRQGAAAVFEDEAGAVLGWVGVARLQPAHGDPEL